MTASAAASQSDEYGDEDGAGTPDRDGCLSRLASLTSLTETTKAGQCEEGVGGVTKTHEEPPPSAYPAPTQEGAEARGFLEIDLSQVARDVRKLDAKLEAQVCHLAGKMDLMQSCVQDQVQSVMQQQAEVAAGIRGMIQQQAHVSTLLSRVLGLPPASQPSGNLTPPLTSQSSVHSEPRKDERSAPQSTSITAHLGHARALTFEKTRGPDAGGICWVNEMVQAGGEQPARVRGPREIVRGCG